MVGFDLPWENFRKNYGGIEDDRKILELNSSRYGRKWLETLFIEVKIEDLWVQYQPVDIPPENVSDDYTVLKRTSSEEAEEIVKFYETPLLK